MWFCVLLTWAALSRGAVNTLAPPQIYRLENAGMILTLGVQDGWLLHAAVANRLTRQSFLLADGSEFRIELAHRILGPWDFKVQAVERLPNGLVFRLEGSEGLPYSLELRYTTEPDAWFVRKQLTLIPHGRAVFIARVSLQEFRPWESPQTFAGPGQPVYAGDFFFGVEYPSARNTAAKGRVVCAYPVGRHVGPKGYTSESAVIGAAERGQVRDRFLAYLDRIRSYPVRPFLLYNTWYDLRNYTDQDVIRTLANFSEWSRTGPLQSVVLDDGWDDFHQLWAPDPKRFPSGFAPARTAAQAHGAELGLWMSPLGGYPPNQFRRLIGSLGQGFEKSPFGFCIAGKTYQKWFQDRMLQYVREDGVNYFKLDNLTTLCPFPQHGHRVGRYGQAGLTDAFIAVMDAVKAADPAVMINITRGAWLSPWWLKHCDVVWPGGLDYGFAGPGSKRQQSITYRDTILYKRLRIEQAQFPIHSLMTHGIIKGQLQDLGDHGENLRDFQDDVMMYFGRGVMMRELYLTPKSLSADEWEFLRGTISWATESEDILKDSRMVLGDPGRGEVYGYAHRRGRTGLLVLRNPAATEQCLKLDWSILLGQEFVKIRQVEIIYPEVGARPALPLLQDDNQNLVLPALTVAVLEVQAE
jgi:hypothetical protein